MGNRDLLSMAALCCIALAAGCASEGISWEAFQDPAPHQSGMAAVAPGVQIHYLDFGGEGDALLLLAGNGNSAHIYDFFAPLLTGDFRVIALTRRGFGESSRPSEGYDPSALARDIERLMDALGIERACIAGHSISGVEMTEFAVAFPERVEKIAYIDAAFDWAMQSSVAGLPVPPAQPEPSEADLSSGNALAAYWARMLGVPSYPEADIRATSLVDDRGNYLGGATSQSIAMDFALAAASVHPDFAGVRAPILAIYTVSDNVEDLFPWIEETPSQAPSAIAYQSAIKPSMQAQRDSFRALAVDATVIELGATPHFAFLHDPERISNILRTFFLGLD